MVPEARLSPAATAAPTPSRLDARPAPQARVSAAATARMVDAVVELQRAAPPRAMVVEIPELGDLRVQVALRSGEVHVAVTDPGHAPDQVAGWLRDVETALAQRGFDLHSREERHHHPDTPDHRRPDDPPPRRRQPDRHLRL